MNPAAAAFNATWCDFDHDREPRNPKIKVTEAGDMLCKFTLSDTDVSVANTLRRIILAEVPTMAVELVNVEVNDTVLYDEFLAHRLGLLPLSSVGVGDIPKDTEEDGYKYAYECNCYDGCPYCTVEYVLNVENNSDVTRSVTHFDLIDTGKYVREGQKPEEKVVPLPRPDPTLSEEENRRRNGVLIVKLKKHQKMRMVLQAKKGLGKYHAKYNPTSTAVFRYEPIIQLDNKILDAYPMAKKVELVQSCPAKVFDLDMEDNVTVKNPDACHFCEECVEWARFVEKKPDLVKVTHDKNQFHFIVEAVGQRTAIDIAAAAMRVMKWKLQLIKMEAFQVDEEDRPLKN